MSTILFSAQQSPRIINNILYWYHNDTFILTFEIDNINDEVIFNNTDEVSIEFFTKGRQSLFKLDFDEETFRIQDDRYIIIDVEIDAAKTALFPIGQYNYDIIYTAGEDITTIISKGAIIVE